MFMDMPTVLHKNILKFVQIILEKYWAFFLTHHCFFITPIEFKRNKRFFFTPRWSNLRGKKTPFFHNKKYPQNFKYLIC